MKVNVGKTNRAYVCVVVLMIGILIGLIVGIWLPKKDTTYPKASHVVEIDKESDLVLVEDFCGDLWAFYGTEDWMIGDVCILTMNHNQEIVDARYSGWVR